MKGWESEDVFDPYQVQVVMDGIRDMDYPCSTLEEAQETWREQRDQVRAWYEEGQITSYIVEIWDNAKDIDIHSDSAGYAIEGNTDEDKARCAAENLKTRKEAWFDDTLGCDVEIHEIDGREYRIEIKEDVTDNTVGFYVFTQEDDEQGVAPSGEWYDIHWRDWGLNQTIKWLTPREQE